MVGEVTQTLAEFAADLDYDRIPAATREFCKDLLLDALACAFAGHQGDEIHQMTALAAGLARSDESSVIGDGRLSLAGATLLNSYLVSAFALCDIHRASMTHVSPQVIPAALAIAERDGHSGRELLVALAAGCELTVRIGIGLDAAAARARGWHPPGVVGPFGAAAAAGRLLRLDQAGMARALGLAGGQAAGTFAALGTSSFKFHQCRGALSGLMAALLAGEKFVAPRTILTIRDGGLFHSYSDGGRPEAAIAGLGERWEVEQIALRPWPSAATLQGMTTALFTLVERNDFALDQVTKVRIVLSQASFELHGGAPRYQTKTEALFSPHYIAAAILRDRELTLAQFELSRYDGTWLRRFAAARVSVECDPLLNGAAALVEIEVGDGRTLRGRCDHPRGAPENRLSRAQIVDKLHAYAAGRLAPACIADLVSTVAALDELQSVRSLMEIVRAGE